MSARPDTNIYFSLRYPICAVPVAGEAPEVAVLTTNSDRETTLLGRDERKVRTGDDGSQVGRLWLDYCGDKVLRISRTYDGNRMCNIQSQILQLTYRFQLMLFFRRSIWAEEAVDSHC